MVPHPNLSLIRLKQLKAKTGLGGSTTYDRMNPKSKTYDPDFPLPIKLGAGKNAPVAWVESEVDIWIAKQIEAHRKPNAAKSGGTEYDATPSDKRGRKPRVVASPSKA